MARIPKPFTPVTPPRPDYPDVKTRPISDLPPSNGYLKGEIERLPLGDVSASAEFPMLQGGEAKRAQVSALIKLLREETNDAAMNAVKASSEGGGSGRHSLVRSFNRARGVTSLDGSELLGVVKNGEFFHVRVSDFGGTSDDALKLGGQLPAYYTDIVARLGYTPLDSATYTAADILTKIKTVDGAGSGLDADLLDGQSGAYFLDWPNFTNVPALQPLDSDLTAIAALTTTAYGRSLLTLANAAALAAEVDSFFLTPAEGNAAYQPLDSDLTAIAAVATASYGRSLLALANATALAAEVDSFFLTPAEGNAAYQPLDSDLTAIAALTTTSYGRAFLALADASAARTAIGLVPGTDVQAYDADLAALAALTGTNTIYYRSAANTWTAVTFGSSMAFSGGAISRAALTGDVTATADSNATTIAADAVTYAKMQNVSATSRIIGRKTAAAGDPEECTLSEILDFVGSAAQGDILYRGASSWARLGAGTLGHYLQTQGAGANPQWAAASGGGGGTEATQAEMETATGSTQMVTPRRVLNSPFAAKAWVKWGVTTTIDASAGVSSITDNGTGDWTVNFSTAFSSANYALGGMCEGAFSDSYVLVVRPAGQAAGSCRVNSIVSGVAGTTDSVKNHFAAFGDQ